MRKTIRKQRGFTLIESVTVIGIMMVLMGMAIIQSFGTLESYQANSAQDVVVSQLRVARQLSISQRRVVQIWIDSTAESNGRFYVKYQVQPAPGSKEVAGTVVGVPLPAAAQIMLETGVPDTPMNFGNNAAVYIGNPPSPADRRSCSSIRPAPSPIAPEPICYTAPCLSAYRTKLTPREPSPSWVELAASGLTPTSVARLLGKNRESRS